MKNVFDFGLLFTEFFFVKFQCLIQTFFPYSLKIALFNKTIANSLSVREEDLGLRVFIIIISWKIQFPIMLSEFKL